MAVWSVVHPSFTLQDNTFQVLPVGLVMLGLAEERLVSFVFFRYGQASRRRSGSAVREGAICWHELNARRALLLTRAVFDERIARVRTFRLSQHSVHPRRARVAVGVFLLFLVFAEGHAAL